jgi:SAM-dependent methyltransferase
MTDSSKIEKSDFFSGSYVEWRRTRIEKIQEIFGKKFFEGKTILELGCGYGHIGKYFQEVLNSKVTFCEGKEEFIEEIKKNNPNSEVIKLDQDNLWNLERKFDIIIHWGVLYHLDNWQQDLECAMKHSDLIFLESEVSNSDDDSFVLKFNDHDGYDQALNVKASRPSASFIEKIITKNNFSFKRYDDASINNGIQKYNWKVTNTKEIVDDYGKRRFWVLRKNKE